jgi:hypothetical protein
VCQAEHASMHALHPVQFSCFIMILVFLVPMYSPVR